MRVLGAVAGVAVLAGAFIGISAATASPPSTQFYACMNASTHIIGGSNSQGNDVLITTNASLTCPKGEVVVSWSAVGPQGATGPKGATGQKGPQGATGPKGATGSNGTPGGRGPTGATGAPGPATIAALQGSPCTFSGNSSSIKVTQDPTTGAVSLTCQPVYDVTENVSTGTITSMSVRDQTSFINYECFTDVTTCSHVIPAGHFAEMQWQSGEPGLSNGSPFSVTCPAGWSGSGAATPTTILGITTYYAECDDTSLGANATGTATFT
jgi:hypothetical protein